MGFTRHAPFFAADLCAQLCALGFGCALNVENAARSTGNKNYRNEVMFLD